jgi:hypothetical protein
MVIKRLGKPLKNIYSSQVTVIVAYFVMWFD